jgi:hypothetical protein
MTTDPAIAGRPSPRLSDKHNPYASLSIKSHDLEIAGKYQSKQAFLLTVKPVKIVTLTGD